MSCASSGGSSKKSTAAQRAVETREYDVSSKDLMQSTIGAFQDLGFTIDTLNEEFNKHIDAYNRKFGEFHIGNLKPGNIKEIKKHNYNDKDYWR